jgi:GMP synthase (glutamine-hydrolysing)
VRLESPLARGGRRGAENLMRIHVLQHVRHEGPGSIQAWARTRGHALTRTRQCDREPLPAPDSFDWLVVMGGPMSVHDEAAHPWLAGEKRLIGEAIRARKRVLGICLGAQLVAQVLGARVTRAAQKEIGWFPVRRAEGALASPFGSAVPAETAAFHWHSETFDLPPGAIRLASSEACENQAYDRGGRILGLQCHFEVTGDLAQDMIRHGAAELTEAPFVQRADVMLWEPGRFQRANAVLDGLLATMEALPD